MQESHYREYRPSSGLQYFLKCYWSYTADFTTGIPDNINPVIPDGCVDIIFDLNLPTQSQCFVVGPMTKPIQNTKTNLFGVRLKPGKAVTLFQSPLKDMTDQIISINKIGNLRTDAIADHLAEICSVNQVSFISSVFEKLISGLAPLENEIQYAIHAIEQSKGIINIKDITSRIGWSRQHLTRKFNFYTGLTPKFYSQIIRVNRIIKIYRDKKNFYGLSDLAQIGGYFDQSHMTNEFRQITGVTPQVFLKNV